MRVSWLLRGSDWRWQHVHRCEECGRRFEDSEPGGWTGYRGDEFPELCSSRNCRSGNHGTGCRSWGPYCPACAVRIAGELIRRRELYRD
jgi:hypothetical protein